MRALRVPALCVAFAALMPCAQGEVGFRTERIEIRFDGQLHKDIRWLQNQSRNVVASDPAVQEGVNANGWDCTQFRMDPSKTSERRITDPEFGPALEGSVSGIFQNGEKGLNLERSVRVLLPDKFPDVAIFQTSYRNRGKEAVHIGEVYSQRILLNRKLADADAEAYDFATFQGGAYRWGLDYALIWLKPGFKQRNFLGIDDIKGPEGEGGGMPFIDAWSPSMGVALVHLEKVPQFVSMPVHVRPDDRAELAITEQPAAKFKQKEWLQPGDAYETVLSAVIFHRGDFYDPLSVYGELLRARGINIPRTSPRSAYEPYWKSWGFEFDFTQDKVFRLLPELKSMGIKVANLDDGWFDYYGDWQVNRAPGKFPGGDPDIKQFVRKIHDQGMKTGLWWYPLGVSPDGRLSREHPELLVQDEKGAYPLESRNVQQLCPAYPPAREYVASLLRRFILDYDFDGVYIDAVGLTAVPPCFNPAHGHESPLESFQQLPKMYETIYKELHRLKPDPYLEVCICAMPHSPYFMPYYHIANASDPVSTLQVRRRVKLEKAIRGPNFCVGDCYQVPLDEWKGSSVPESFETAMGTGAQLTTFYADLTDHQRAKWQRWFKEYRELGLGSAEYVNLYDLAFDKPEVHVVRKGNELFYGVFADVWPKNRRIELRGLKKDTNYDVYDYEKRESLGQISGAEPYINKSFKDNLLLRVRPAAGDAAATQ